MVIGGGKTPCAGIHRRTWSWGGKKSWGEIQKKSTRNRGPTGKSFGTAVAQPKTGGTSEQEGGRSSGILEPVENLNPFGKGGKMWRCVFILREWFAIRAEPEEQKPGG